MKNINSIYIAVLLSLLFTSCIDDIVTDNEVGNPTFEPIEIITTTVNGIVTRQNGTPISDALIIINNATSSVTTTTDANGYYEIFDIEVEGQFANISVILQGLFDSEFKVPVDKGRISKADFKINSPSLIGSFQSSTDATISKEDDVVLQFSKNSIAKSDGSSYDGDVEVYINNLEPQKQKLTEYKFGGDKGENASFQKGKIYQHQTIQIELKSPSGEFLNISEGKTVKVTIKSQDGVPSSIAGNDLSIMHYDLEEHIWKEEAVGEFNGQNWTAEVPHFSTWTWCTFLANTESASGLIQLIEDGQQYSATSYVIIDYGDLQFLVPTLSDGSFHFILGLLDVPFTLIVWNECEEEIYSEEFGTPPTDGDFGTISINSPMNNTKTLSVSVFNCDDSPVEIGYSRFCIDGLDYNRCQLIPIIDGFVAYDFLSCDEGLEGNLFLLNEENLMTTQPIQVNLNDEDLILEHVSLCDTFKNNFTININGSQFFSGHHLTYGGQMGSNNEKSNFIGSSTNAGQATIGIEGPLDDPQTYPFTFISMKNTDSTIYVLKVDPDMTFNLEEFEPNESDPDNFFLFPARLKGTFQGTASNIDPITNEVLATLQIDGSILID